MNWMMVPEHIKRYVVEFHRQNPPTGDETKYHHRYTQCPYCGRLSWRGCSPIKDTETQQITVSEEIPCRTCERISINYPEIFEWITRIIMWHKFLYQIDEDK